MSRHLRLSHTSCQCFWRCPVPSCPMWLASELNRKDHLERIHSFTEGRGYSFYDCLCQFGLEWFGRLSFFDQRDTAGHALWMDLALERYSGHELHNNYVLTNSLAFGNLKKFFRAAVRELAQSYNDYPESQSELVAAYSICDQMRRDIVDSPQRSSRTSSLSFLQTGPVEDPHVHVLQSRRSPASPLQVPICCTTWSHCHWTSLFTTTHRPGRKLHDRNYSP